MNPRKMLYLASLFLEFFVIGGAILFSTALSMLAKITLFIVIVLLTHHLKDRIHSTFAG